MLEMTNTITGLSQLTKPMDYHFPDQVPKQENTDDCGPFVLLYCHYSIISSINENVIHWKRLNDLFNKEMNSIDNIHRVKKINHC